MGYLKVTVVEARNLIAADRGGTSDPYVVLKIGTLKQKSKVIRKTLDPKWNETFTMLVTDPSTQHLEITVYDKDILKDDHLGQASFPLNVLVRGKETSDWVPLNRVKSGEVLIKLKPIDFGKTESVADMNNGMIGGRPFAPSSQPSSSSQYPPSSQPSSASQYPPSSGQYPSTSASGYPPISYTNGNPGSNPIQQQPPSYQQTVNNGGYPPNHPGATPSSISGTAPPSQTTIGAAKPPSQYQDLLGQPFQLNLPSGQPSPQSPPIGRQPNPSYPPQQQPPNASQYPPIQPPSQQPPQQNVNPQYPPLQPNPSSFPGTTSPYPPNPSGQPTTNYPPPSQPPYGQPHQYPPPMQGGQPTNYPNNAPPYGGQPQQPYLPNAQPPPFPNNPPMSYGGQPPFPPTPQPYGQPSYPHANAQPSLYPSPTPQPYGQPPAPYGNQPYGGQLQMNAPAPQYPGYYNIPPGG